MHSHKFLVAAIAGLGFLSTLSAQISIDRGRLIGLAADTTAPSVTPPTVQRQVLCRDAARVCAGIGQPATAWAGGLAYNAARASIWQTQGTRMAEHAIDDCRRLCSVPAQLLLGPGSVATGLALVEGTGTLYQIESIPGTAALHQWSLANCPPQVTTSCRIALPSDRHLAGAVAVDRRSGFIYYATSVFGPTTINPLNQILVARLADPCSVLCSFPVAACSPTQRLGPITGLALDECDLRLYATDGNNTVSLRSASATPCDYVVENCCPRGPAGSQSWFGLDIEGVHPIPVGDSCLGGRCPDCNRMRLIAHGDPAVGNPFFGISVVDGPAGGRAFLAFNVGRCTNQTVPFLCGPFYPDLNTLPPVIISLGVLGGAGCNGSLRSAIPVPVDYSLCEGALCFQGIVICPVASQPSIALTNALQIIIDA
jgi:hypothetical protein